MLRVAALNPRLFLRPTAPGSAGPEAANAADVAAEAPPGGRPGGRADRVGPAAPADGGAAPRRGTEGEAEASGDELTQDEQQEVERLKERDAEVRRHEQAHATAGGAHAGAPTYSYETGPDGRRYAVEGSVPIDTGEVPGEPRESVVKLQQVIRAALAPAQPSPTDLRIAASAQAKIARLKAEMTQEAPPPGEGRGTPADRADEAYHRADPSNATPRPSVEVLACQNCGRGH